MDALCVFPATEVTAQYRGQIQLIVRSGRPTVRVGRDEEPPLIADNSNLLALDAYRVGDYETILAFVAGQPRTNYRPIECNFYDRFEAAITLREVVGLVYRGTMGREINVATSLRDIRTHQSEEFVQLADGQWVRLDRIVSVDGIPAGASCTF